MSAAEQQAPKKTLTPGKAASTTGIVAALAASSCCIPPVIAAVAGIGGFSSGLSWMEPLRPYLIGLAVIAIGYAWYAHLKPKNQMTALVPWMRSLIGIKPKPFLW